MSARQMAPFWREFQSYAASVGFDGRWNRRTTLRRSDRGYLWGIRVRDHGGEAELLIQVDTAEVNLRVFHALREAREPIEERFGGPLLWEEVSGRVRQRIAAPTRDVGVSDTSHWKTTWDLLLGDMQRLSTALLPALAGIGHRPRIRASRTAPSTHLEGGRHRDVEQILIEADLLTVDHEGIPLLDGRRAAVRSTRGTPPQVGWECEVEIDGRRTGERRLAEVYVVAELSSDSDDIVRLRCWDAESVRPLLRGSRDGTSGAPGWTHGVELDLSDPQVAARGHDLTRRLW